MTFLHALRDELVVGKTAYLLMGWVLSLVLLRILARQELPRLRWTLYPFSFHLLLTPMAALASVLASPIHGALQLSSAIFAAVTAVGLGAMALFGLLLPLVGIKAPRIVRDVVVGTASVLASLIAARHLGFNVTGLIATSAILTAALALSLQDTLGNIISGLVLQVDRSIAVGDWIRLDKVSGRVTEINWHRVVIETRNWESVVIPNSAVVKSQVTVLGRRQGKPPLLRRWVTFNVDFRYTPSEVIRCVSDVLRSPMDNVATDPAPNCILMDLGESYARYAVRYWLTDFAVDDPTDSDVRRLIFFALRRAGIPLSMPAHAIFLTEESMARKDLKRSLDHDRRLHALERVMIFQSLSDEERRELATHLRYSPFTAGEVLTHQGAVPNWLYLIIEGQAVVRVKVPDAGEREVAQLGPGDYFGEGGVLTGEPRNASVVAVTDVLCLQLEGARFRDLVRERPEIASDVADTLGRRTLELDQVKGQLSQDAQARKLDEHRHLFLEKVRKMLSLTSD